MLFCFHKANSEFNRFIFLPFLPLSPYFLQLRVSHQIDHCFSPTQKHQGLTMDAAVWLKLQAHHQIQQFPSHQLVPGKVNSLLLVDLTACWLQCCGKKGSPGLNSAICWKFKTVIVQSECCESKQVQLLITSVLLTTLSVFLLNVEPTNEEI